MASATPLHTSTVTSIMAAVNNTHSLLFNTTSLFPLLQSGGSRQPRHLT
jgi:hypothetical protein